MFGVIVPVGPDSAEPQRLRHLLDELRTHEDPHGIRLVVIDDHPTPRALDPGWPDATVIRTSLWDGGPPDAYSAMVAGTLEGLRRVSDLEFAVKLDTDAAIIAPFSAALRRALSGSGLGVVGSYDRTPQGTLRDWSVWRRPIDRAARPILLTMRPRPRLRLRPLHQSRYVSEVRRKAYRAAPPGAHCLGGAYAVSAAFLRGVELDWRPWVGTGLSEDVVVGLLSAHAGLPMRSLTRDGEPFGVAWRGLPAEPPDLVRRGYSIVHSVRGATDEDEMALRGRLQAAGAGGAGQVTDRPAPRPC